MNQRKVQISRKTTETEIELSLNLDGEGKSEIEINIPFLQHMLALFAKHGLFDMSLKAKGDLKVDAHHTVEDTGICLGQALKKALGEKIGISRFGYSLTPMDEALTLIALDISSRPLLSYQVDLNQEIIGDFDINLTVEFFRSFVNEAGITLHIIKLAGENSHHIIESIFKGLGKALDMATIIDSRIKGIPSTKGEL